LLELLENHHAIRSGRLDRPAVYVDRSFDGRHESADGFQQSRLAASGRSENDVAVALLNRKIHPIGRSHQMPGRLVLERYSFHLEQRRCHWWVPCVRSQLPGKSWISPTNISFQFVAFAGTIPTRAM